MLFGETISRRDHIGIVTNSTLNIKIEKGKIIPFQFAPLDSYYLHLFPDLSATSFYYSIFLFPGAYNSTREKGV